MKQNKTRHFLTICGATFTVFLTSCATESTIQVDSERFFKPYKGASKQEFIGFADGRAYEVVTLVPFAPWSIPKTVIRSCPLYDMNPEQVEVLKSRIRIPRTHDAKLRYENNSTEPAASSNP